MIERNEKIEGLHPDGFTSLANTAKLYDVSTATLRRRWKKGLFPLPVKPLSDNPEHEENFFRNSDLLEYNAKLKYVETA